MLHSVWGALPTIRMYECVKRVHTVNPHQCVNYFEQRRSRAVAVHDEGGAAGGEAGTSVRGLVLLKVTPLKQ